MSEQENHGSPNVPPRFKQAVVFFHGIGEQIASESVERFADAVLAEHVKGAGKYTSAPDESSYQLRVLRANERTELRPGGAAIRTPRATDFFEFYWAHKPDGMELSDSMLWLAGLLFRRPPRHLLPLWGLSWILVIIAFVAGFLGISDTIRETGTGVPEFTVTLISGGLAFALEAFVIRYLGDAALYFKPTPKCFTAREEIMEEGVKLLRRLSTSAEYSRIIVVGHSLGSVIAYDVLRHLWESEFWDQYQSPRADQPALEELEAVGPNLRAESTDRDVREYQEKQLALWHEMRSLGNPWRITDFVTLGSPLAHASLLFRGDIFKKQKNGELPTNPPQPFSPSVGRVKLKDLYALHMSPREAQNTRSVNRYLKRDGCFAMTRWTNIYFPTRFAIFGDFIGGPLRSWFGSGIKDQPVAVSNPIRRFTPLAHLSYWKGKSTWSVRHAPPGALYSLIKALDLNGERLGIPREEKY